MTNRTSAELEHEGWAGGTQGDVYALIEVPYREARPALRHFHRESHEEAIARPVGRLSSSETLTSGEVFSLRKVIVKEEMPFGATVSGVNVLLIERSLRGSTVKSAVRVPVGARF